MASAVIPVGGSPAIVSQGRQLAASLTSSVDWSTILGQLSFDAVRTFMENLTTTEGRVAVSAVIVVVTAVLAVYVAPLVIHKTGQLIRDRLLTDSAASTVDVLADYIPTTVSELVVWLVKCTLLAIGLNALLLVWGLLDIIVIVFGFVSVSAPVVVQLSVTGLLFLAAYVASRLLEDAVEQFSQGADRITDHQREIILRVGHLGIIVFTLTGALTLWGIDLSGLLVGAGFLGIVVGLAARQTLGSMIAGFVLMFSRPFTIGDWIEVGDDEGIVTDITIMNTRLQNFDGESIVIPNDAVSNRPITNRSEQGHLRIRIDVGIDYQSDPEHAETVAVERMKSIDSVADTPPPDVVPKSFGDSAIVLEIRFWIDRPIPPQRWRATRQVIIGIKEAFEDEGIKIPYPQRELSGRAETGGFRVHDQPVAQPADSQNQSVEPATQESDE